MTENELRQMAPDPEPMKNSNHALEEMLRRQQARAQKEGQPFPPPLLRSKPGLIDKARLLYRIIQLIKNMKKVSWKTTLGGVLIAAGQAVPSILPPAWHWLGNTLSGIGALVLGTAAVDSGAK